MVSPFRRLELYTGRGYIWGMRKDIKTSCLKRLHRIEGQVRGLSRMVEEDRYCIDIVTQISAVRAAAGRRGNPARSRRPLRRGRDRFRRQGRAAVQDRRIDGRRGPRRPEMSARGSSRSSSDGRPSTLTLAKGALEPGLFRAGNLERPGSRPGEVHIRLVLQAGRQRSELRKLRHGELTGQTA